MRDKGKNRIPYFTTESHASESHQYSHIRAIPSASNRMSNTNPHRFPRPPTLPQSKIQIQSQREQGPVESGHLTFSTTAGRTGKNTLFGVSNEKEEPESPGTFTTSFDLLSIARVVPAKPRRVSNPIATNEGQVADTSTIGESLAESTGVHGDWRKLPSATGKEVPSNPDTIKPMIFRRVAIPSSRLARHPSSVFASDKANDTKTKQPATTGDLEPSTCRSDGFSFFENKNIPPPMEALKTLSGRDVRASGSSQKGNSATIYNLPGSCPPLSQQDVKDDWIADGDVSGRAIKAIKDKSNRKVLLRASENITSPNPVFQTGEVPSPDSKPGGSGGFTQPPAPPVVSVKSLNDNTAGILRAAAAPFEPKGGPSPDLAILSKIQLEESTSAGKTPLKLGPPSDPFANLPGGFYKGSASPPPADLVSPANGANVQQPSMTLGHWRSGGSHRLSESGERVMGVPKDESSTPGAFRGSPQKKTSLGDAEISQLWDFPRSGSGSQAVNSESPSSIGSSVINFNPNAKSFAGPKTSSDPVPSPNKLLTSQITVRDEAMEQIVPTPRKSLSSDLQIVERLEIKAMVLSESESDIVTALLEEASIGGHTQQPTVVENPVPQMDERGRRGAISLQGTVRRPDNSDISNGGPNNSGLDVQKNKEPSEARTREAWLEPAGEIKIRIKGEGNNESADQYWPYPYPRCDVSAKEITTQLFVELNEQMVSYIRVGPDGIRLDHNWGRFKFRKGKSGYPPGQEPWLGGDNISFFDMSFGVASNHNTGKVTIKPPPGLSLAPVNPTTTVERMKTGQTQPGGLRDLVENSTPDYNHYNDNYKKLRARTLQEWNLTPISSSTSTNPFNSYTVHSRQGSNISSTGQPVHDGIRGQVGSNERSINSARDSGMLRNSTLMGGGYGSGANGQGGVSTPTNIGNELSEEGARRRRPEQKQCAFGATGAIRLIVFGGSEGSDDV